MSNQALIALKNAHNWGAIENRAKFYNYGWVGGDDFLLSKTDRGYLETRRIGRGKYVHTMTDYEV